MEWDAFKRVAERAWHIFFPDRHVVIMFLLALFISLSIFSVGFYLNDEMEQGTNFYNLLQGDLTIEDIPQHYYSINSGVYFTPRFEDYGGHKYIAASHGMSVFSVPFFFFLKGIDVIMSVELFFVALWSITLGAFLYCSAGSMQKLLFPTHKAVKAYIQKGAIVIPTILFLVNLLLLKPLSYEMWGPVMAMQFMSLTFVAMGLTVVFRLFRSYFDERTGFFSSFLLMAASPVAFWALGQKYHGLHFSLLVFAFATFCYGKAKNKNTYHYASYIFAGLAVWVQLYSGVVILLSLFLIDVLTTKQKRLKNVAIIVAITGLSLIPYFAENYAIYENPLYPGYMAKGNRDVIPPDPPDLTIIYPLSGWHVGGVTPIHYNVSADTIRSTIEYTNETYDGWIGLPASSNVTNYNWNTSSYAEGIATLRITARNWRGDETAKNVSVHVDNSPPSISFVTPSKQSILVGNYSVLCNVTSDVERIDYAISIDNMSWQQIGNDSTPYNSFLLNTTTLQGNYYLQATATDYVGYTTSTIMSVTIDNSGAQLILRYPQDNDVIGGLVSLDAVIPADITNVSYEYRYNSTWQIIGKDTTSETPFVWDTYNLDFSHGVVDVRCTAYHDGHRVDVVENSNITLDNRSPTLSILEPQPDVEITGELILAYTTSSNTVFTKIQYSSDNTTWSTIGVSTGNSFILGDNISVGRAYLRLTVYTRSGLNTSAAVSFAITGQERLDTLGRLSFIFNSLEVGWEFLKRKSALEEPGKIPENIYKSFFNARDTEARFAFFVFVPFLILSLFSPLVYYQKKKQFGMIDKLMFTYIVCHLFIFVNVSIHQGGGDDMRWYLPLYLPFVYFSVVVMNALFKGWVRPVIRSYLASLIVLFPVLLWACWITGYQRLYWLAQFSRWLNDILLMCILLVLGYLAYTYYRQIACKHPRVMPSIKNMFFSLLGVAVFSSTWILFIISVVYSRGVFSAYPGSSTGMSMMVPIMRILQEISQSILK